MKPDKRNTRPERGRSPATGAARDVDAGRPFPQDYSSDDPDPQGAADRNFDAAFEGREHGEGNYQAAKDYGKRVRSFVRSGQVEPAAEAAEPHSRDEARELVEAERQGRKRSKGEDPSTKRSGAQQKRR